MKKTQIKKLLSLILCMVLIAAMALMTTGCNDSTSQTPASSSVAEAIKIGEGDTKFDFSVIDANANQTNFEVSTNKKTVGEALLELNLIAGEDSQYGLYVKTVNGITLDYNTDGKYWAFYVNDVYATSGVDTTEIKSGEKYAFKAE